MGRGMTKEQGTRNKIDVSEEQGQSTAPGSLFPVPGSWDVIGQEQAVAVLRRAVQDEARLSHAYLFVGPERVGRATTARRFAQALNCEARTIPPTEVGGMTSGSEGEAADFQSAVVVQ